MTSIDLLDTPRRASLSSRSTGLRAEIKNWERSFAASHDGRKPGKSDIKACADIAAKYKEFQKLGDVLAGKLSAEVLLSPRQKSKRASVRKRPNDATPQKAKSGTFDVHPNVIDPYDTPSSATPKRFCSAIGPTPQRDGKVLGLFDVLSDPGGSRASKITPGSQGRKRKADVLDETDGNRVFQTPSRKKTAIKGDILEHLTGVADGETTEIKRIGKTPTSESKKFMLSHFFATPSAMRYASLVEHDTAQIERTPLRDLILGSNLSKKNNEHPTDPLDTTPVFLKRSHSFRERLVSVKPGIQPTSPSIIRRLPPTLRTHKSAAIALSQIVQDIKAIPAVESQPEEEDEDEDAIEAMRELEDDIRTDQTQTQVLSDFEGQGESELDAPDPPKDKEKVWKKKGQKRTTKKSHMKPARVRRVEAPKFIAPEESEDEIPEIEKAQLDEGNVQNVSSMLYEDLSDDELFALDEAMRTPFSALDVFEPGQDGDFEIQSKRIMNTNQKPMHPLPDLNNQDNSKHAFKPKTRSKPAKINPNALSHQNFKTLKIRNRNSKAGGNAGGRGRRFGGVGSGGVGRRRR